MKKIVIFMVILATIITMLVSCGKEELKKPELSDPNGVIIRENIIVEDTIKEAEIEEITFDNSVNYWD